MSDNWEIALERPRGKRRLVRWPYVSLNRRGKIAMNAAAFGLIGKPATVALYFDRERRAIGVKFPVAADRNFYPVRRYGRGRRMRIIRAARMMRQFGIEIERTQKFENAPVVMFHDSPMLVLELDARMAERENTKKRSPKNHYSSSIGIGGGAGEQPSVSCKEVSFS